MTSFFDMLTLSPEQQLAKSSKRHATKTFSNARDEFYAKAEELERQLEEVMRTRPWDLGLIDDLNYEIDIARESGHHMVASLAFL